MRLVYGLTTAVALALLVPSLGAQGQGQAQGRGQAPAQDEGSKAVAGGGISVNGWAGKVDASEEKAGLSLKDAKFASDPKGGFHVTTGPATTYWNLANKASGNYTVSATFYEPEYMNLNTHPHPYG